MDNFVKLPPGTTVLVKDISNKFDFSVVDKEYRKTKLINNQYNLISEDKHVLDRKSLFELKSVLSKEASDFLRNAYNFQYFEKIEVTTSWFNETNTGHKHHIHDHPYSVISGVLYLDDNPENLNFTIHKAGDSIPGVITTGKSILDLKSLLLFSGVDVSKCNNLKNHIILFLSNIEHSVGEVKTKMSRRSMAFNTFFKGYVGDPHNPLSSITY